MIKIPNANKKQWIKSQIKLLSTNLLQFLNFDAFFNLPTALHYFACMHMYVFRISPATSGGFSVQFQADST